MIELILQRHPPGDRWIDANDKSSDGEIFISLTDGLEYAFKKSGVSDFQINAKEGSVYLIRPDPPKEPEKLKSFSLYGEDY